MQHEVKEEGIHMYVVLRRGVVVMDATAVSLFVARMFVLSIS